MESYYNIFGVINLLIALISIILAFVKPVPASKVLLLLICFYVCTFLLSYILMGSFYIIFSGGGIFGLIICLLIPFIICYIKTKRFI